MSETPSALDRLALAYGVEPHYLSEDGKRRHASDEAKRAVLAVLGVNPRDPDECRAALADTRPPSGDDTDFPEGARSYLPAWLEKGKCWGLTCQLYGLRSARNDGIGDFEDLATLAERVAEAGGDFIGVNPLHALFTAAPDRCSPFAPSNRRFLNPLYIALDRIPGLSGKPDLPKAARSQARAGNAIDYGAVARLKLQALRELWQSVGRAPASWQEDARADFEAFAKEGGDLLHQHALFEVLSHHMAAQGHGAGWRNWPAAYRDCNSAVVRAFARDEHADVDFHKWLQWIADRQLASVAARAQAAGLRIGLYLDLAVGNAPDGSATWMDPALVVPGAHIGAPPDTFFPHGQDWGLAPMSPLVLNARDFAPYRTMLFATMRHAGAVRIDHAMSLARLFWIPEGHSPSDGCYVRYPPGALAVAVADTANRCRSVVIGEDLGTVPPGFSTRMRAAGIMSCRILYFERTPKGFRAVRSYPRHALLSVSSHDLPPLAAWWSGTDTALYRRLGLLDAEGAKARRASRAEDRVALLARLRREAGRRAFAVPAPGVRADTAAALSPDMAAAIHGYLARAPSRLLAVQFEDICGAIEPVNVPGTLDDHPNWRLRAPLTLEEAAVGETWRLIVSAVARERPRR